MKALVSRNKDGNWDLGLHTGTMGFFYKDIKSKDVATGLCESLNKEIAEDKLDKLRSTLKDSEIRAMAMDKYPVSHLGFFENTMRDRLRTEFIQTAKYIRDKLFGMEVDLISKEDGGEVNGVTN